MMRFKDSKGKAVETGEEIFEELSAYFQSIFTVEDTLLPGLTRWVREETMKSIFYII